MDGQSARDARDLPEDRTQSGPGGAAASARRAAQQPADIAIVGMGAIMPGAPDLRRFWENILDKVGAIAEVPADRWPAERYFDPDRGAPDKIVSKWGGFLPDTPFDPMRFGIPPTSVASIDPAQLLALVVAEAALADAGLTEMSADLRRRASVILGFTGGLGELGLQYAARAELGRALPDAPTRTLDFLPDWTSDSFAGLLPNVVAGRIANRFDFGGSNFVVDAACATSLAALRQAVIELETGRSDIVLCGAVEAGQGPFAFTCFSKAHALSPAGTSRAFDAAADGTAISEGIAMLVLRRLEDAEAAGDRIYAVIKGIDGSSDGRARGLMAPLPAGQKRALGRAYEQAAYSPATVDLFEAHGTGTVSGDASEIESLSTLLIEAGARPKSCAVGSVKALIGHAEGAAGLAGLVKVALGLHHRILPPHAGVAAPNAALRASECPIALHQAARPWLPRPGAPRRAGVSAFGFGGTNYHVTLEEHREAAPRPARAHWPAELFLWRAADRASVAKSAAPVLDALRAGASPPLAALAAALAQNLGTGGATLAIVAGTREALTALLAQALERRAGADDARPLPPGIYFSDAPLSADGKVAMLFPGQGSQHPDMGRELGLLFPEVGRVLEDADAVVATTPTYRDREDKRLSRLIYPFDRFGEDEEAAARAALASTDVAQPALGAIEVGMLALTRRLGLEPSVIAGHSYGEYVALHAAGVLDFRDLMRVSEARGRSIIGATRDGDLGTMAACAADATTVRQALGDWAESVVVANLNGPNQTVISGPRAAIAAALERLGGAKIGATPIPVSAAFHSPLMQPAQAPLVRFFDDLAWNAPRLPVYANTTGAPHAMEPAPIRALLERHLTEPVDFMGMIGAMYAGGARVFLEVGPKTVLASLTRRILGARPHCAVSLDGVGGGIAGLLHALAALMVQGVKVDASRLFEGRVETPVDLADIGRATDAGTKGWLVNGSRARRTGDAVRTAVAAASEGSASHAGPGLRQPRKTRKEVKEVDMHGSHGPVGLDDDADRQTSGVDRAMVEHQRTMQQFLQMQERLMMAYLGGGERPAAPARPFSGPRPAPARVPMPARGSIAPPAAPPRTQERTAPPPAAKPAVAEATPSAAAAAPPAPTGDLKSQLLAIASEKTGYPEDMLGLDLNMEADLGIDSIKRVEILAALRQSQPAAVSEFLQPKMTQISKSMSLQEILDRVAAALQEMDGVPRPFDQAGEEPKSAALSRYVMRAVAAPLPTGSPGTLAPGLYLLAADRRGIASALTPLFENAGAKLVPVPPDLVTDDALAAWLVTVRSEGNIRGIIGLAGAIAPDTGPRDTAAWRAGMATSVKALFPLLRLAAGDLEGGLVAVVSAMGGRFGRDMLERPGRAGIFPGAGGGVGLVKCLSMEWTRCRCVAIDLDPNEDAARAAAHIHAELAALEGPLEVGFPQGTRTIFRTEPAALPAAVTPLERPGRDWIVVAVGGARGITAETLRPFAEAGAGLVILGRSSLPGAEDAATATLTDAAALRRHFLTAAVAGEERPTPARIETRIAAILRDRETRANMADFARMGAHVDYRICDVRDETDVAATLRGIYKDHRRIDALLFGAGLIEDRLITDKSRESLDRVFDTKVDGAFFFARHLRADGLKFVALFTSVAGRYGNRGQTDYGAANEVLNRYAWQLQAQFGARTKVTAVNWGPWARTTNGPGMLTPATARQFRERGLHLIEPQQGRDFLWNELLFGPRDEVEVVAWEMPSREPDAEIQRAQSGKAAERAVA